MLAGDRVYFGGSEAWDHLSRIRYVAGRFPAIPGFDSYALFPHGAEPPWPALLDWILGACLALFARMGGPEALERAAAWVPPILGAGAVVAAWWLARRHFGERVGIAAGAFVALLGGHFAATQLGALDARSAASLLSTLLLAASMRALDCDERAPALAVGVLAALCLLVWPGSLLPSGLALGALGVHALVSPAPVAAARRRHAAMALAVAAALIVGAFLLFPSQGAASRLWDTLGGPEPFFAADSPGSRPLLVAFGRFEGRAAVRALSYLLYFYPLLWALGLREALRSQRPAPLVFFSTWAALLFTLVQFKTLYLPLFSVVFAISCAWSLGLLARQFRVRGSDASGLLGLAIVLCLLPLRSNYVPHLRNLLGREEGLDLSRAARVDRLRTDVAAWMSVGTPPTDGWLGGPGSPQYGVLGPPEASPVIRYLGRRPTLLGGAGSAARDAEALSRRVWSSPPDEAARSLDELPVRYLLVRAGDRRAGAWSAASLYRTLSARRASGKPDGPEVARRFRLLYESGPLRPGPHPTALYRLYELVPGARIEGRAAPGAWISLDLDLLSHDVREFRYEDRARAGPDGRYRFVVPYSNVGAPGYVKSVGRYRLSCQSDSAAVMVREQQVRSGASVAAPDLCLARGRPRSG